MENYRHAWKVRKIQLIIVNIVFAALGIVIAYEDRSIAEGLVMWIGGSWMVETMIACFTKSSDRISNIMRSIVVSIFSGIALSNLNGNSVLLGFLLMFSVMKIMIGVTVLCVLLAIEFVSLPFTSIYLSVKSRKECIGLA